MTVRFFISVLPYPQNYFVILQLKICQMNNAKSLELTNQLSPYLFWDIDIDLFDVEKNSSQLIQRVLEYGELDDWRKVKVDIIDYSLNWIDEPATEDGVTLASPKDIAALKINAIEGRGNKKDFIDIYVLLEHYSLDEILSFYASKYPNHSILMALKSLMYFEDAENQTMPKLFINTSWDTIKKTIVKAVNDYQK